MSVYLDRPKEIIRWLICKALGHRLGYAGIALEGHKLWRCVRCNELLPGAYVR